jgi:hypothetical protein
MDEEPKRRWYQPTWIEWCVIATILLILAGLMQPSVQSHCKPRRHSGPDQPIEIEADSLKDSPEAVPDRGPSK